MGIRRLACAGLPLLLGCVSHERYTVSRAELVTVAELRAQGRAPQAIAALREQDGKAAAVRLSALRYDPNRLPNTELVSVEARAKNRLVTAGSVFTWVGTAISLFGTGLFAAGRLRSDDGLFLIGAVMSLSAEPIMWTGTGLWIGGALRRPYEVTTSASPAPASTSARP